MTFPNSNGTNNANGVGSSGPSSPKQSTMCPICRGDVVAPVVTPCNHVFCSACLTRHLKTRRKCPTCLAYLTPESLVRKSDNSIVGPEQKVNRLWKNLANALEDDDQHSVRVIAENLAEGMPRRNVELLISALSAGHYKKIESETLIEKGLLANFLALLKRERESELMRCRRELKMVSDDVERVRCDSNPKALDTAMAAGRRRFEYLISRGVLNEIQHDFYSLNTTLNDEERDKMLTKTGETMRKFSQFTSFRRRESIFWSPSSTSMDAQFAFPLQMITWAEFNANGERFAAVALNKQLKVYEFQHEEQNTKNFHLPVKSIDTSGKPLCVSWNPEKKQMVLTCDRDGGVTLWDVERGVSVQEYDEHDKSVWSVDFNRLTPSMFASGSDDAQVKIWNVNMPLASLTIQNSRNVCSVKFNPEDPFKLAFGSIDQCVHYLDLRYPREPLQVFVNPSRVSYVNFRGGEDIICGLMNSSMRLWNLKEGELVRTYTGHRCEKNFVGRGVNNDYIVCGSEDNSLYAYLVDVSSPIARYRFGAPDLITGTELHENTGTEFVSAACWSPTHPTVCVAGSNNGVMKVLELQ